MSSRSKPNEKPNAAVNTANPKETTDGSNAIAKENNSSLMVSTPRDVLESHEIVADVDMDEGGKQPTLNVPGNVSPVPAMTTIDVPNTPGVDPATITLIEQFAIRIQAQFDNINSNIYNLQMLAASVSSLSPGPPTPGHTPKRRRTSAASNVHLSRSSTESQHEYEWTFPRRPTRPRKQLPVTAKNDAKNNNMFELLSSDDDEDATPNSTVNNNSVAAQYGAIGDVSNGNSGPPRTNQVNSTNSNSGTSNRVFTKESFGPSASFGNIRPLIKTNVNANGMSRNQSNKNMPGTSGTATAANNASTASNNKSSDKTVKKVKLPPIIATCINVKDVLEQLNPTKEVNFKFRNNFRTKRTTFYAADRATYDALFRALRENGVPFHTQTLTENKRTNLILKDVPHCFDLDDVKRELSKFQLGDKLKVVLFRDNNKASFNYYIISIPQDVNPRLLLGSHHLFYTTVKIEKFNKNSVTQCYKCSQLGHVQGNCYELPACHKCGQGHESPDQCPIVKETPHSEKFCVLCQVRGHAASYRGCPTYKRAQKMRTEAKSQRQKFAAESARRLFDPSVSFAQMTSGGNGTVGSAPTNPGKEFESALSFLDKACLESFNCTLAQFQAKYKQFHTLYSQTKDREAKKSLLFNFLASP